ncbi:Mer1p Ecym_6456 [Eremothecium cymbalariae DBVPG|uniref:K Homology domain-containing protein n=1 Tax=Eremothecium cymbalariae (strain CBS 270.75 / DBVPG 7215 / KCTC 17166 / NRRL Y-17582) TaxID=931890 RepID=G8JUP7_ERECY|nr:hypothetical protein Ecym_6456 [Eremothecium cymbalariae DBVPG\
MNGLKRHPLEEISNFPLEAFENTKDPSYTVQQTTEKGVLVQESCGEVILKDSYDSLFREVSTKVNIKISKIVAKLPKVAHIVVRRWAARDGISKRCLRLSTDTKENSACISAYDTNNALLSFQDLDIELLQLLSNLKCVSIILPPMVLAQVQSGCITLETNFQIWADTLRITTRPNELIKDLYTLVSSEFYSIDALPIDQPALDLSTASTLYSRITSVPDIITEELELNKPQISFLIGENGVRIEHIKQTSYVIIKVLPIKNKLHTQDIKNPASVHQNVTITGELYCVAKALAAIHAYIDLYNMNLKHKF